MRLRRCARNDKGRLFSVVSQTGATQPLTCHSALHETIVEKKKRCVLGQRVKSKGQRTLDLIATGLIRNTHNDIDFGRTIGRNFL